MCREAPCRGGYRKCKECVRGKIVGTCIECVGSRLDPKHPKESCLDCRGKGIVEWDCIYKYSNPRGYTCNLGWQRCVKCEIIEIERNLR
jgi:hypothetical protein